MKNNIFLIILLIALFCFSVVQLSIYIKVDNIEETEVDIIKAIYIKVDNIEERVDLLFPVE